MASKMTAPKIHSSVCISLENVVEARPWAFYLLVLFGLDFVSCIFIKNFQTFLEVKADINRVNLTSCLTLFFDNGEKSNLIKFAWILIARKSALKKTQLSDVLITDNLF